MVNTLITKSLTSTLLTVSILALVVVGVASNYYEQISIDKSKLPSKVEDSTGFQRWITNLKNKGVEIEADNFRFVEENEIYNTKWMRVYSADNPETESKFKQIVSEYQERSKIAFSPSNRQFVDYRQELRNSELEPEISFDPNEIRYFGQRDDKILEARVVDCSIGSNCYFDRAFFLPDSNDVFVVTELSRNILDTDINNPPCDLEKECEYVFKVHVIDLINNSRTIYKSQPFLAVFNKLQPEL